MKSPRLEALRAALEKAEFRLAATQDLARVGDWELDRHTGRNDRLALDTGCVWGRRMTMLRLEDRHPFTVACR